MQHSDITLFALGLAGVLLNCLFKISKLKEAGTKFSFMGYIYKEWPSIITSVIVVIVAIICKNEIGSLKAAGNVLGLGFVTIGYTGQSILLFFMEKARKGLGIDKDKIATMLLIASIIGLSSCGSLEGRFEKLKAKADHSKNHKEVPAGKCASWFPYKDSVHESIKYIPGRTDTIPGEVFYADCDSAYRAAMDEASRQGYSNVVVKKVAIPCPPSTITHDTILQSKEVYQENTAKVNNLQKLLDKKIEEANQSAASAGARLKWAIAGWGAAIIFVLLFIAGILGKLRWPL